MGSKRAPSAPNPAETAAAQSVINTDTARVQARLNRGNTVTPFGTVINRDLGNDQWETVFNLSPNQQRIADQGEALDMQTGQLTLDMLPEARRVLMQPLAMDDPDARERATAGIMSRMEPQFARDRAALESRLVAQGFTPGTEAFRQAADEQNRAVTDARLQATTAGLGESRNAAAFQNALRGQRINELGMLFGLGPGMQMPQQASLAGVGVNAPDLMGQTQANYAARTQQYGANMAALGQLFGAAGSGAGAYFGRR
jgi:hypothetical protein